MALLAKQRISTGSNTITYTAAAAAGDTIEFVPGLFLGVRNDDVDSLVVTIAAVTTSANTGNLAGTLTVPSLVVTIVAGAEAMIGIPAAYASGGVVTVTYDDETSVTVAAQYVGL